MAALASPSGASNPVRAPKLGLSRNENTVAVTTWDMAQGKSASPRTRPRNGISSFSTSAIASAAANEPATHIATKPRLRQIASMTAGSDSTSPYRSTPTNSSVRRMALVSCRLSQNE
ncbi:hypothetical protein D3C72_1770180 [compost metagenome]